ncbi:MULTISPECIES: SulP family inorganic anion transporter [unclassified Haladaptatus]|uniref:SulP family inorganic anion transporter n=1 Tax=unclassified Haladaptatus TaxID=2622732 RepID=UPI00209BFBFE|nr:MULTISPECIES: SulP family inorganic anion transporter [unclassified Haladaptatus]MCO8243515.1 SulP family inorganic anion transporter [Haladaptatus sp. AB643]MCO8254924.1 SulP family inorganic anion transporter [Haladaptatus sp. AB618]
MGSNIGGKSMASNSLSRRVREDLKSELPVTEWLPKYDRSWLRIDIVSGLTVSAAVIPGGLAYASLAGLPPQTGLYAALMGALAYVFFASSRQVIVGPTSPLAILLLTEVGPIATGRGMEYASLVTITTIIVGIICVVAWVFRLGYLVNFISGSVLTGFASGAGLYIISTQLGKLLGISGSSGTFFQRVWFIATHLTEAQSTTVAVGLVSIALLLLGKRFLPRAPTALLVVLLSIVVSSTLDLQARGVTVVGQIQSGLPPVTVPSVPSVGVIESLVPVAIALFILSYVQGIGAVQTFARRNDYRADPDQELLADGAANVASGLFGGFVVGGSMSRSALNDSMNGKSQIVSAVIVGVLVVVLLFLTGLFRTLPDATLGAVVIVAVIGIVDVDGMQRLHTISRNEFFIAAAALLGVLALGMLWGVFIGVFLSLTIAISRASNPKKEVLARIPDTDHFVSREQHPEAVEEPGVLVYRVDAGLFYANTNSVLDDLLERIEERQSPVDLIVFDLSTSPMVDLASVEMFEDLHRTLEPRGIELRLAGVNEQVLETFEAASLDETLGEIREEGTVEAIIDDRGASD